MVGNLPCCGSPYLRLVSGIQASFVPVARAVALIMDEVAARVYSLGCSVLAGDVLIDLSVLPEKV